MTFKYLLGDAPPEAERLAAQGRLWDPVSLALFDRVGVRPGWKVLEIGPGMGSLHMALRQRVQGPVDAVERSETFATALNAQCASDGFGLGQVWQSDLLDTELPAGRYQFIFARWVFLFLPHPELHVRKLFDALAPGGILAIQDYHRETMTMIPRPEEWPHLMAADRAFFATHGGDASVGSRLPRMFHEAGLELLDTTATLKTGHPNSAVWDWISTYFFGVMERLAALPPFSSEEAARLSAQWRAAAQRADSLLIAPALLDVVGRKA